MTTGGRTGTVLCKLYMFFVYFFWDVHNKITPMLIQIKPDHRGPSASPQFILIPAVPERLTWRRKCLCLSCCSLRGSSYNNALHRCSRISHWLCRHVGSNTADKKHTSSELIYCLHGHGCILCMLCMSPPHLRQCALCHWAFFLPLYFKEH